MLGSPEFSAPAPVVNLWNKQTTTFGAKTDLFFVFWGYLYPLGDLFLFFFCEFGTEIRRIMSKHFGALLSLGNVDPLWAPTLLWCFGALY